MTYLALYTLIGAMVGATLSWHSEFTKVNQIVGAIIWPATVCFFLYGFLKSFLGNGSRS